MSTNNEAIDTQSPEKSISEMQITEDTNLNKKEENMDNSNSENAQIVDDVEDGELPEDGEIMDDEDEEARQSAAPSNVTSSETLREPLLETPSSESQSTSNSVTTTKTSTTPATTAPAITATTHGNSPAEKDEDVNSKKRGPSSPDDSYQAKRQALSPEVPQLPPRRRATWTEAVLCKFFREGYCRDGENCAYSHNAAHSNRKPELCKFYQQGFCKKGLACTLLHGEYPCKAFHEGRCDKSPCKYSHVPLNDYTRTIFEQMVQDEALASRIVIPQHQAKRKVLLRRPPPNAAPQPSSYHPLKSSPPREQQQQPMMVLADSVHDFGKNTNAEKETKLVNEPQPFVAMTAAQDPDEQMIVDEAAVAYSSPKEQIINNYAPEAPKALSPNSMSITDMLDQLAEDPMNSGMTTNVINLDDLMNSPVKQTPAVIADSPESPTRIAKERVYRLIPLAESAPDYDIAFLKKITSDRFKDDPRIQSIIQKQFDRASNMFGQNMPTPTPAAAASPSSHPPPKTSLLGDKPATILSRDPRTRPAPVDPRQRPTPAIPSAQQVPINGAPPAFSANGGPSAAAAAAVQQPPVSASLDDPHFKSLVEKQLQMVNEFKLHEPEQQPQGSSGGNVINEAAPRGRFREDEEQQYGERREYDRGYSKRGYNERPQYNNYEERPSRFDEPYQQQSYDESEYRGSSRYGPPTSRGRGGGSRGFNEADRYAPPRRHGERFDSRWEGGGRGGGGDSSSYRREPYRERERRDYSGRTEGGSTKYRERSRSRSPRRVEAQLEDRPLTMREKRKNNEYQSPLARA